MKRRFVGLDRDGTLIVERHYLSDPAGVELLPGAAQGLRLMRELGLGLVLVTNQSGVGRGFFDERRLDEIHQRLGALLQEEDVSLDGIFYCPHTPADQCGCRKPEPGLLLAASKQLDFETRDSFFIGDKACDIELGRAVGATTILVRTGYGAKEESVVQADYVVDDLIEAAGVLAQILGKQVTSLGST